MNQVQGVDDNEWKYGEEAYWKQKMGTPAARSYFPYDRISGIKMEFVRKTYDVPCDIGHRAWEASRQSDVMLFVLFVCSVKCLLQKYSGETDITIVAPIIRKSDSPDHEPLTNAALMLRDSVDSRTSFKQMLYAVKNTIQEAEENRNYPIGQLLTHISKAQDDLPADVAVLHNGIHQMADIQELGCSMRLAVTNDDGSMNIGIVYDKNRFRDSTIDQIANYLIQFIGMALQNSEAEIGAIKIWPDPDETISYLEGAASSMIGMIQRQATMNPEGIAVQSANGTLTYAELNSRSNRLARYLREDGVGENQIVGILVERSLEMIIAILAVHKAGAAYLPIDPDYPLERIEHLLQHSEVTHLICRQCHTGLVKKQPGVCVIEIEDEEKLTACSSDNLPGIYDPERLIYVLYTSGSTGLPKGVMVKNSAFENLIQWYLQEFSISAEDKNLLIAPISFDLAQKNVFASLAAGGTLVVMPPGIVDYAQAKEMISKHEVTIVNCSPSAFYPFLDFCASDFSLLSSVKWVILGGEPINPKPFLSWLDSGHCNMTLVNSYGPTECTDIATFYIMNKAEWRDGMEIPIGTQIPNVRTVIVNKQHEPLPYGIAGELAIGGAGLSLGYYKDNKLTSEKFIHLPRLNGMFYLTGDNAVKREDGVIEFIGRSDDQIKVGGFRVELGEISSKIRSISEVTDAIVVQRSIHGRETLCAYFVADVPLPVGFIKTRLERMMPSFMIPPFIKQLGSFPLSPNGKIDKSKLPVLESTLAVDRVEEENLNETEHSVKKIWEQALGNNRFGLHENFFDIGGDSIRLIQVHHSIEQEYPGMMTMADLFSNPTVHKIANHIIAASGENRIGQERQIQSEEKIDDILDHLMNGELSMESALQLIRGEGTNNE